MTGQGHIAAIGLSFPLFRVNKKECSGFNILSCITAIQFDLFPITIHTCRNACRLNDCCGGYYIILNVFGDRRIREMKKVIGIVISVLLVLCFAGCSQTAENKDEQANTQQENSSALAQNNNGIDLYLT